MVKNENPPSVGNSSGTVGPAENDAEKNKLVEVPLAPTAPQSLDQTYFNNLSGQPGVVPGGAVTAANGMYERLGVPPPRGVCILHPDQTVCISGANALIFDVDETLLVGSGKHAHDGIGGRFHGGVNSARLEAGLPAIDDHTWETQYEILAGAKESVVIRRMAALAGVEPTRVEFHASRVLEERIHEMLARVPLATGARELLISAGEKGIARGILSASSELFVGQALKMHDVLHHFDARVCSAEKKLDHGVFSGNPIQQICRELAVDPRDVVMIGDSTADYATHRLGVMSVAAHTPGGNNPVSIMIVPNHHQNRGKLDGAMSEVERFHISHNVQGDHGTLLVISSFEQVRIGPATGNLCWHVS
jgi:phosphoglycolate phosphatase-like HAD superfamily hydrolase